MVVDERRGNQQRDADEEKEESSLVLPCMLGEGESVSGEQEGEHGEDEQENSHV